jgi:hypothetical protein
VYLLITSKATFAPALCLMSYHRSY